MSQDFNWKADETSHTIGELEFGPDGNLYIASGDGGSFGRVDPINLRALDTDSLAGKILRIDPITGQAPSDNPFYDGTLIFTDIGDQVLRAARFNSAGEVVSVDIVSQNRGFIVDMETGRDGFQYYVEITGSVGRLDIRLT